MAKKSTAPRGGVFPENYSPISLRHNPEKFSEVTGLPITQDWLEFVASRIRHNNEEIARLKAENVKLRRVIQENRDVKSRGGKNKPPPAWFREIEPRWAQKIRA